MYIAVYSFVYMQPLKTRNQPKATATMRYHTKLTKNLPKWKKIKKNQ